MNVPKLEKILPNRVTQRLVRVQDDLCGYAKCKGECKQCLYNEENYVQFVAFLRRGMKHDEP